MVSTNVCTEARLQQRYGWIAGPGDGGGETRQTVAFDLFCGEKGVFNTTLSDQVTTIITIIGTAVSV